MARATAWLVAACAIVLSTGGAASSYAADEPDEGTKPAVKPKPMDHTGRKKVGTASYYHDRFAGRKMANGERMDPKGDNAASKTLPLGTTAKVTNLENGRSTTVTIEDRGPYVKGRIIDVSPGTARKLGIEKEEGLAKVEVAPIAVPQPDGSVKAGDAARDDR